MLLAGVVWIWLQLRKNQLQLKPFLIQNRWLILATCLLFLRQFFSPMPSVSFWYMWKGAELGVCAWCYRSLWPALQHRLIFASLLITILFQIGVISYQFFAQQPLFPYFVLGETRLTSSINIARSVFQDGEKILPYGTTAHPNIAAGFLIIVGVLWLMYGTKKRMSVMDAGIIALLSWAIFATQSVSAGASLIVFLLFQSFFLVRQWSRSITVCILIAPLLLSISPLSFSQESIFRRNLLNQHALRTLFQHPWWGSGLGVFTVTLKNQLHGSGELVRFVQPVHHGLMLLLAETGVLGILFFWCMVGRTMWSWFQRNAAWLLLLAPLIALDHYLFTQWVGGFSLTLMAILTGRSQKILQED